jgi:hypothetical protein
VTQLSIDEGKLFYKLHSALMFFANERLELVRDELADPQGYTSLPPEARIKIRDAVHAQPDLIDEFVRENLLSFTPEELKIVASWREAVVGKFIIFRYLKNYTVFLTGDSPYIAYGVLALADPFEELVGPYLPILTDAVLLPFKGKITYDGLLSSYRISFGGGMKRSLNGNYRQAKERLGIVTSLPAGSAPVARAKTKKPKRKAARPASDEGKPIVEAIVGMTDQFCRDHLNDEYLILCRKLVEKLGRKRPSPLLRGKPTTWACGIVRTIGWVNFLDDNSQSPHMSLTVIDKAFGVSQSTGQSKSREIRKMLRIQQFDPNWCLPSLMDDNPMVWMLEVNGFILDIRNCSREMQESAFEKGLIPYIPADRG